MKGVGLFVSSLRAKRAPDLDVVFFGTPPFALPALEKVAAAHRLKAVVTQPDKPRGRHGRPQPSPTKQWAQEHGIPVLEPAYLKDNHEFLGALSALQPDVCVVAAYGRLLTQLVLDVPKKGFINIHGSLLPRYRGSAPIQRALMAGDKKTGVTIMQVVLETDAGDILKTAETDIKPGDDYGSLATRLSHLGAEALLVTLAELEAGTASATRQDEQLVTQAPPIIKEEAQIDWRQPAASIFNLIRGLAPKPGAFTRLNGKRLKILRSAVSSRQDSLEPGELRIAGELLDVGTGTVPLELLLIQPEGKRKMTAAEFVRGHRLDAEAPLGPLV